MTPVEMARAFFEHTGRRGEFNETSVQAMLDYLAEHQILIVSEKGIVGGMVFPCWVTGEIMGQEILWWGDAFLHRKFESRARQMGATAIHMMSLTQRVADHYLARGYKQLETVFVKEF